MKLKLTTNFILVEIEDTKGETVRYELREMCANDRERYLDLLHKRLNFDSSGNVTGVKVHAGLHEELVSRCLFKPDGSSVTVPELEKWPSGVVSSIYDEARKINRLGEEKKDEPEKNG